MRFLRLLLLGSTLTTSVHAELEPVKAVSRASSFETWALPSGVQVAFAARNEGAKAGVCVSFPAGTGADDDPTGQIAERVAYALLQLGSASNEAAGRATPLPEAELILLHDRAEFCRSVSAEELPRVFESEAARLRPEALSDSRLRSAALAPELSEERLLRRVQALALPALFVDRWTPGTADTVSAARRFHATYYRPERARIAVAAPIESRVLNALLVQAFEGPGRQAFREPAQTPPPQTSGRYLAIDAGELVAPVVQSAWVVASPTERERAALEMAGEVLAGASGSVLDRALVERELASEVRYRLSQQEQYVFFSLIVRETPLGMRADVSSVVEEAVQRLASVGPSASELERARQAKISDVNATLRSELGLSRFLSERNSAALSLEPWPFTSVTAEDVRRVVIRNLTKMRRNVAELVPRNAPDPAALLASRTEPAPRSARNTRAPASQPSARPNPSASSVTNNSLTRKQVSAKKPSRVHEVRPGDTLIGIARRYSTSVAVVSQANRLDPKRPIRIGQKLLVR